MTDAVLLEPSFADLIAAIVQAPELAEQRRRHWVCSLQQIAQIAGPPSHGHPGPLERSPAMRDPIAPRSGRRNREDRWRTINPTSEGRCAGSARSTTCRSEGCRYRRSG